MWVKGNRPGSWKSGQRQERADWATHFKLTGAHGSLQKRCGWKQIRRWNPPGGRFGTWGPELDRCCCLSKRPLCSVGVTDELIGYCLLLNKKKSFEFINVVYRFALNVSSVFWREIPCSIKTPSFVYSIVGGTCHSGAYLCHHKHIYIWMMGELVY